MRAALNPFASTIGYLLPYLVSGSIIVSLVLSLPTVGPLLLQALVAQDMFLAGTIVLLLGVLTVIGTLISDLLLMWIDPRIRLQGRCDERSRRSPTAVTDGRRARRGRHPAAAHLVALPAAQAGAWSALVIVALFYLVAVFADFLAYADPHATEARAQLHPAAGDPLVRRRRASARMSAGSRACATRRPSSWSTRRIRRASCRVALFAHGYPYNLFGLIPTDRHLLGVEGGRASDAHVPARHRPAGARPVLAPDVATRISLTIGLVGVTLSLVLGVLLGGISGLLWRLGRYA